MQAPPQPYMDAPPQYESIEQDAHALLGDQQEQWAAPPPQPRALTVPVCLPQLTAKPDAAFARGYNEHMMASGIAMADWLRFLDALNNAMAGSPPLRIVSKAAKIAGYATGGAAEAVHIGIKVASYAAGGIQSQVQKSLTDRVIKVANETLFAPRGLRARIFTTEATRVLVRTGNAPPELAGVDKLMNSAYNAGKQVPILGGILRKFGPASERLPDDPRLSLTERRIASLGPYVMPMYMNVPPAPPPNDWTARLNAKYHQKQGGRAARKEDRADMNRHLLAVARGEAQPMYASRPGAQRAPSSVSDSSDSSSSSSDDEVHSDRWERKMAKRERRAVRAYRRGRTHKFEKRVAKAGRREAQHTDDVLWIVLLNEEQDRSIEKPTNGSDDYY